MWVSLCFRYVSSNVVPVSVEICVSSILLLSADHEELLSLDHFWWSCKSCFGRSLSYFCLLCQELWKKYIDIFSCKCCLWSIVVCVLVYYFKFSSRSRLCYMLRFQVVSVLGEDIGFFNLVTFCRTWRIIVIGLFFMKLHFPFSGITIIFLLTLCRTSLKIFWNFSV